MHILLKLLLGDFERKIQKNFFSRKLAYLGFISSRKFTSPLEKAMQCTKEVLEDHWSYLATKQAEK